MSKSKDNKRLRLAQDALWNIEDLLGRDKVIKMTGVIQGFKFLD